MKHHLLRLLRLHDATPGERSAAIWTAAFFFCVLCAYYLLRPLREEIGTAFGKEHLLVLFVQTFALITVLNPIYMLLANRLPTSRFLPAVLHAFALSFVVLAVVSLWLPPLHPGPFAWTDPERLVAAFFYSWVTAFVVCGVALVWVHAVDYFTTQQGKRLFGFVAVGGTLGAIVASALALVSAELARGWVMLVAAAVLELGVLCHRGSLRACLAMVGGGERHRQRVASAGVFEGLRLLVRSPYLLGIAAFVLLAAVAATAFYYALNDLAAAQIGSPADRRALFSAINLGQNVLALGIQVWVTRSALLRLGLAVVLCVMPAVTLLGLSLAAVLPAVAVMAAFEVARRTLQFAFDKPARDVLFTPLGIEAKYKSKAFVDTAVLRLGDLLGAAANDLLLRLQVGAAAVAAGVLPFVVVWGGLGFWLGRRCRDLER
ncbi:MAG: hypothetical protein KF830_14525 [Planctomycetes bacterium]|nr:hypothetical protein [Planctomycetota bacterium]